MHVGWKWFGNFQTLHYLTMHSVEEQSESPGLLFVYWRTHRSFPTYRMLPGCCWSKSNGDSLDAFSRSTTHTQNHEHFFFFFFFFFLTVLKWQAIECPERQYRSAFVSKMSLVCFCLYAVAAPQIELSLWGLETGWIDVSKTDHCLQRFYFYSKAITL